MEIACRHTASWSPVPCSRTSGPATSRPRRSCPEDATGPRDDHAEGAGGRSSAWTSRRRSSGRPAPASSRAAGGGGGVARRGPGHGGDASRGRRGRCSQPSAPRSTSSATSPGVATLTATFVRTGRADRRPGPRHPQDDAGPARPREGGGRGRGRYQSPDGPLRRDPDQGEPRRDRRRGGGGGAAARARRGPSSPSRWSAGTWTRSREAIEAGADRLLLDNMEPGGAARGGGAARRLRRRPGAGGIGRHHPVNVREIAETGVDYVSVGALTHSAPALDLSMTLEI